MKKTVISSDAKLAARVIQEGGNVIFPTETVYGIGASSFNEEACLQIYSIKNRPKDNPFIVHIASLEELLQIAYLEDRYLDAVKKFSPGPITYILPKRNSKVFSSGLDTIGVRIPENTTTLEFLKDCALPVSAPSANISGKPSITRKEDAIEQFDGKVDFILLGEEPTVGLESTVIDLSFGKTVLLRPGRISYEELSLEFKDLVRLAPNKNEKPLSPGLKYRHYAPDCKVVLLDNLDGIAVSNKVAQIGFTIAYKEGFYIEVRNNRDYMKNLYSFFIDCEKREIEVIYCQKPLKDNLEEALLNRIMKASTRE